MREVQGAVFPFFKYVAHGSISFKIKFYIETQNLGSPEI